MCVFLYFSTTRFGMSSFWVQKNRVSWKLNCMRAVKFRKNKEQIPSWKICVSQDFLDPIKTVYLRGLHIAHLETTYLEALLYLVLFLGFRVDFFSIYAWYTKLHFLESAWHNQKLFSEKNFLAPNECWHFIFAVFFSDVRISINSVFTSY